MTNKASAKGGSASGRKKIFTGKVVSDKMQKTVVVAVERQFVHPIYGKTLKRTGRIKADTANLEVKVGQYVVIEQARPISRGKNFKVIKIIEERGKGKA